jgi:hypothetical protein
VSGSHPSYTIGPLAASDVAGERGTGAAQTGSIVSQPPWNPQGQDPQPTGGQPPPYPTPPYPPQPFQPGGPPLRKPRSAGRKVLAVILGVAGAFVLLLIGAAIGASGKQATASPGPTVTVVQHEPGAASTVTVTATPTANAQGEATQISQDGVYVVGQDIPGGTWHTSGGSQCYEATLGSTDTSNIIDNNFTGPDTVSLAGQRRSTSAAGVPSATKADDTSQAP